MPRGVYERERAMTENVSWRMSPEDRALVERLSAMWGCSQAEAFRTALRLAEMQVSRARG